jgi:hypothetical protein
MFSTFEFSSDWTLRNRNRGTHFCQLIRSGLNNITGFYWRAGKKEAADFLHVQSAVRFIYQQNLTAGQSAAGDMLRAVMSMPAQMGCAAVI